MGDRGDLREARLYLGWQVVSLRYDALRIPPRIVVCRQSASEPTGGAGASIMLQMAYSRALLLDPQGADGIAARPKCGCNKTDEHIRYHSITSSAWASSVGGIVRPSSLAVFRLVTSLWNPDGTESR